MNYEQAEAYLLDLELFGMRFGLDRMHKLMTVLGMPQRRFACIHVVGSNGKSSTVRMIAAILERHGLRTGTYTSPHLRSFARADRGGGEADRGRGLRRGGDAGGARGRAGEPHGRAGRPRDAVRGADRGRLPRAGAARRGGGRGRGRARRALRRHQRDPVEGAGAHLGGASSTRAGSGRRWPTSRTRSSTWCATTRRSWSGRLPPRRRRSWRERGGGRGARARAAGHRAAACPRARAASSGRTSRAGAGGRRGVPRAARRGGGRACGRGGRGARAARDRVGERPLTIHDGAHNPSGAAALAASAARGGRRPPAASWRDRRARRQGRRGDAARAAAAVRPRRVHAQREPALALARRRSLARSWAARRPTEPSADPRAAVARAAELAGPDGAVIATGSIYLIADLVRERSAARASRL